MKKGIKKTDVVDGQNIVYHIIQKKIIQAVDVDNPPAEVKFMIEQLLLWGGVWFRPKAYEQIPVLRPYAIRNSSCRNKDPEKDTWAQANSKGLMKDDNSSIKDLPKSLPIISEWKEINGKKLGKSWVASHVWMSMQTRDDHACEWERTNSFIPNLVWLPSQLSKLTDRDGSYAQQFLKHISYQLYSKIRIANPMISGIWSELKDPGITPESKFSLDDLNYFDSDAEWIDDKKAKLNQELQSILAILDNPSASVKTIYNDRYTSTLRDASKTMALSDKENLEDWIKANRDHIGGMPVISVAKPIMAKIMPSTVTKKSGKVRRLYHINGLGEFSMCQVIEKYIEYKLEKGISFTSISPIKGKFISEDPDGVSIGSGKDAKPYSFNYKGKDYYVTTQLRDNDPKDNFCRFRTTVSAAEPDFIITPIMV
jgi:hypothetical protein